MQKQLPISCIGADLPYEKYKHLGAEALTDAELLAIILRTGTANASAIEIAKQILTFSAGKEKGLNSLHHVSIEELQSIHGIGEVKAVKIKCITELAVRMARETAASVLTFQCPETVANYYMEQLRHEEIENILLLLLDNKLHLIKEYKISIGTANASLVTPREIFIQALTTRASRIMLLHNHPSGDPSPSKQDILITKQIREAGALIGIPLIDHIIIGDNCYSSLKEKELI